MTWLDWVDPVASVVTAGAVIFAVKQIRINRKQLYLSTMDRCISSFRAIDLNLDQKDNLLSYLDLCNEELFYMEQGYLPKEVGLEWTDGMIDLLPITDETGEVWNRDRFTPKRIEDYNVLVLSYPRVKYAFTVVKPGDPEQVYGNHNRDKRYQHRDRLALCKKILKNVKRYRVR